MNQEVGKSEVAGKTLQDKIGEVAASLEKATITPMACPLYVSVRITHDQVTLLQDDYYDNAVKPKINLKGFRAGQVPKEVVIRRMGGKEVFYEPVYAQIVRDVLRNQGLEVVVMDNLKLIGNAKEGYSIQATIFKTPQVVLPEDMGFLQDIPVPDIDEVVVRNAVEKTIRQTLLKFATFEQASTPVETGHRVTIKTVATCGNKKAPEYSGIFSDIVEAGSNSWWHNSVIGLKEGDEVSISIVDTNPHSKFFDQSLKIQINVQSAQKIIYPPINERMLEHVGFRTENAWREAVFRRFHGLARDKIDSDIVNTAIDKMLPMSQVDPIPMAWIDTMTKNWIEGIGKQIGKDKMLKTYDASNMEDLKLKLGIQVFLRTRDELTLRAFGRRVGLDVMADGWRDTASKQLANFVRDFNIDDRQVSGEGASPDGEGKV